MGRADREFDDLYGPADSGHPIFDEPGFETEPHRRRSGLRRTLGCLIPLVLVGAVVFGGYRAYQFVVNSFGSPHCTIRASTGSEDYDPDQAANAATITTVGVLKDQLPVRAATVALATAMQESKLRNLNYGDLDSLGLFQQRHSQGWGTPAQIMDPVYASNSFYKALQKVTNWQTLAPAVAAQEVQRSAYPDAYAAHITSAAAMAQVFSGNEAEGIGCRLDAATHVMTPASFVTSLTYATGAEASVTGTQQVTITLDDATSARAIAAWSVAQAQNDGVTKVTLADREWKRERGTSGAKWHGASTPSANDRTVVVTLA